jgi:hypothetical protein
MKRDALLTDLPVSARVDAEDVGVLYSNELQSVKTEEDLEKFTERWEALWRLPCGSEELSDAEASIVSNSYNKEEALQCIAQCRDDACEHAKAGEQCAGMNIVLPCIMMQCFFIAHEYGAPFNVALVQLQKALGNLPDSVAFEVF